MQTFITESAEETRGFGKKLAAKLQEGTVIALTGQLGAGKTTLIQGIAQGLGIKDPVTSPTFILINEYPSNPPLIHLDLYRLDSETQIEDLGIEDYFEKPAIMVIEWAEKLGTLLPSNAIKIELEVLGDNKRRIAIC
ncbi:MAG: tRNA (adenosine(37)-N6)-threonylcarbamoyltransferase complex ATPase subunit type 1 TsaE [Candidatus Saganbacteria bacterium]|nr:tRNA (adenosine(37)-N6)-threonylcarbamoyltransferase complex ATPase subunit type 1 TsaE [Candidatus Saganbacteria bacterium]